MVDSSREALKYRIDLVSEMKFLKTSDGEEVSTEATDCEMELWRALQASRSAAIEECAAWVDCKGYKTTANELRRLKGEG